MGNCWRFDGNPFWHHEWRNFDIDAFVRFTCRALGFTVSLQIGLALLLSFVESNPFWAGTNLLLIALGSHFVAINYLDRQAPKRSFTDDAQKGSLDFLRLLPISSHKLVVARKLPFWFLRLFIAGLWAPLYAFAFASSGLPPQASVPTSLLLGMVDWLGIFGLVLIFSLPAPANFSLVVLFLLVTLWSSDSIQRLGRISPESRSLFVTGWAVCLALGLVALQFEGFDEGKGVFNFFAPQPFYGGELMPIWAALWLMAAAGWTRVDRLARWLEMPKGLRRFLFAPSLSVFLFIVQGYLWGWLQQVERWHPSDCFSASAAFTFAFSGILHWLWFNWTWAERTPPEKPMTAYLVETALWRTVSVIVSLFGCWLASARLSQLDLTFLHILLLLSALDAFAIATTIKLTFRAMSLWNVKGFEFLLGFAFVPIWGLVFKLPFLVAFSPSLTLLVLGWKTLAASTNPIKIGSLLSVSVPSVPLWLAATMPVARTVLLAIACKFAKPTALIAQRNFQSISIRRLWALVNRFGEIVFVLPALERVLLDRSQNPVFRHMVSITRWRYGWLPYFAAFVIGLLKPLTSAYFFLVFLLLFVPLFWFATYLTVHAYLRKLHQTGELWMWLITPLPSKTIVNGWRYGGWWWQFRWLSLPMWLFIGGIVGGGISYTKTWLVSISWLISVPLFLLVAVFVLFAFAIMIMGVVPTAISDALREPQKAFSAHGHRWSRAKALGLAALMLIMVAISVGSCGFFWFVAPIVGLAITSASTEPSVQMMEYIRKSPMERLPLK